ncbi:single-stranded DNA-binding protein [Brachybacterium kimchii]|uniref:Single-stranded DNA-binding protein n=1 Tax=Brachybacterium kimchii TaxID=2942909 RepID=A0ABY4N6N5_9MICO|nr:single-stranded DNA-binding protein [Brachybacterium kimchii]UQN29452.1 single-stranded DNA-binding protein [Brachybacterium kimchii]
MSNETIVTVVGNLTADPELRFTQAGIAVAGFTIASTPRTFNRQSQQWEDGEALFLRSSAWRDAAENVAESLEKGSRVIAQGHLRQRSFTDREGNQRTSIELDVLEIGPSLRYATAKPVKVNRQQGGGQAYAAPQGQQGGFSGPGQPQGGQTWPDAAQPGQGAPQGGGYAPQGGGTGDYSEPPF